MSYKSRPIFQFGLNAKCMVLQARKKSVKIIYKDVIEIENFFLIKYDFLQNHCKISKFRNTKVTTFIIEIR